MYKKKMLLIIVSTFIIPFLLFGQIREEAERIHELFFMDQSMKRMKYCYNSLSKRHIPLPVPASETLKRKQTYAEHSTMAEKIFS